MGNYEGRISIFRLENVTNVTMIILVFNHVLINHTKIKMRHLHLLYFKRRFYMILFYFWHIKY